MLVTSVRDSIADRYLGFQLIESEEVAIRSFKMALSEANDKRSGLFFFYPGDFDLYLLGEFDDESAAFNLLDTPRCLYHGSSYVVLSTNDPEVDNGEA